jgi:beta-glucanase (GH16 family)
MIKALDGRAATTMPPHEKRVCAMDRCKVAIATIAVLISLSALGASSRPARANPPGGQGYAPVFTDEFNGTSLNTADWNHGYPTAFGNNGHWASSQSGLSCMEPSQDIVSNGFLDLRAVNQTDPNVGTYLGGKGGYWNSIYNRWVSQSEVAYTSGAVNTDGKRTWHYGYIEGRFLIPWQHSAWPAFWSLQDGGWPPELDIFEFHGQVSGSNYLENYTYHFATSGGGNASWGGVTTPGDAHAGWHVYGVDWQSDHLTYYVDGVQIANYTNVANISQMTNMYLLLNNQVGGWAAAPAAGEYGTTWGSDYECDWVRVWQKRPAGPANGTYRLTPQSQQGTALDVAGWNQNSGAAVDIYTASHGENQKWGLQSQGDGTYEILPYPDYGLNLRLDQKNGGTTDGTVVQTFTNNGAVAQRWFLLNNGGGWYRLIPTDAPSETLTVNGGGGSGSGVSLETYTGAGGQLWRLDPP